MADPAGLIVNSKRVRKTNSLLAEFEVAAAPPTPRSAAANTSIKAPAAAARAPAAEAPSKSISKSKAKKPATAASRAKKQASVKSAVIILKDLIRNDTLIQAFCRLHKQRILMKDGTVLMIKEIKQGTDCTLKGKNMKDWQFVMRNMNIDSDLDTEDKRYCTKDGDAIKNSVVLC